MSQENVEPYKRGTDAFNGGDLDAALQDADSEVVFRLSLPAMFGGEATVIRGPDEYRHFYRDLMEVFAEFRIETSEIREVDELVVGIGRIHARGKESGAAVESPIGYVVEFRNGKIIRVDDYFDPEQALQAAGLSE